MDDLYLLIYPEMFPSLDPEIGGVDLPLAECEPYDCRYGRGIERTSRTCAQRLALIHWDEVRDIERDEARGLGPEIVLESPARGWHYTGVLPAHLLRDLPALLAERGFTDLTDVRVRLAGTQRYREIRAVREWLENAGARVRLDEAATLPPRRRQDEAELPLVSPARRRRRKKPAAAAAPVVTRVAPPEAVPA